MVAWIVRRALTAVATFVAAAFVLFYALSVAADQLPSGQVYFTNPGVTPLVLSLFQSWLGDFLTNGGLQRSVMTGRSAEQMVLERVVATLLLMGTALVLEIAVAIPLGVIAATHSGRRADHAIGVFASLSLAAPVFVVGLLAIYIFAIQLHWFPSGDLVTPGLAASNPVDIARHVALPALVLAFSQVGRLIRYVRVSVLEELTANYVVLARATGQSGRRAAFHHALPNALLPVITVIGVQAGQLLAGAFLLEIVFNWPGAGRVAFDAIQTHDTPVLIAFGVLTALVVVTSSFLADVAYVVVDPRVRAGLTASVTRIGDVVIPSRVKHVGALVVLAILIAGSSLTMSDQRLVVLRLRLQASPSPSVAAVCSGGRPSPCATAARPTFRPTPRPSPDLAQVRATRLQNVIARFDLDAPAPGCMTAIEVGGAVVYQHGFGQQNLATGRAIGPGTIFDIAGVTEEFTAVAILLLAQDGRLSLEDDVRRFVPELPVGQYLPLTDLLYHESGLVDLGVATRLAGYRASDQVTADQILGALAAYPQRITVPGLSVVDTPTDSFLLGVVVERVTGQALEGFLDQRIFGPLDMRDTALIRTPGQAGADRAIPYLATYRTTVDLAAQTRTRIDYREGDLAWDLAGAGGIRATAGDLLRWATNIDTGQVGGRSLVVQQLRAGASLDDGLLAAGVRIHNLASGQVVFQVGGRQGSGFRVALASRPDDRAAAAVLCNVDSVMADELAFELLDAWLVR